MPDQDNVIARMRMKTKRPPRKSFMAATELKRMRVSIMRVTQKMLGETLIDPESGEPTSSYTVCRWEGGKTPIPLWVARKVKLLAESAREFDTR